MDSISPESTDTQAGLFADRLESAQWCAHRGWAVFPLRGKEPTGRWQTQATTDPAGFAAWFIGSDLNLGLACGPSGLVVVDEDEPGGFAAYAASVGEVVPPTFTVRTARGRHFYFAAGEHQLGNAAGPLKPFGVDVRGFGGYVVGPGSVHPSGARYLPDDPGARLAPVPTWLGAALREVVARVTESGHGWLDPPARGLAGLPEVIPAGERHDTLHRYASSLRAQGLPWLEAEVLVEFLWQRCAQPSGDPLSWADAYRTTLLDAFARYDAPEEVEPEDAFAADVEQKAYRLRVEDAARAKVAAEREPPVEPDVATLAEVLARPEEPPYRVEGLVPSNGSTLVVAQRKTGKTTLLANLARSLLLGAPFLDRFEVLRPVSGQVAVLNYEVSGATMARWLDEAGVPATRCVMVNLRATANPLADEVRTARLAARLREQDVETLVVDPFGQACSGDQNNAAEVSGFLSRLGRFAREQVGARDLILAAHAGWNGERTRGSSALEDWADVVVTMTEDHGTRFLRAIGRDVEVAEDRLHFDPATRRLTMTGSGSRSEVAHEEQVEEALVRVLAFLADNPGSTQNAIEAGVEGRAAFIREAARRGIDRGLIVVEEQGRSRLHSAVRPGASQCVPDAAGEVRPRVPIGDADVPKTQRTQNVEVKPGTHPNACGVCGVSPAIYVVGEGPLCQEHLLLTLNTTKGDNR